MLLELLILVFLLWIYSGSFNVVPITLLSEEEQVLEEVKLETDAILRGLQLTPNYNLIESQDKTYVTNKETIHLLIRCPQSKKIYPRKTLLTVTLHEMAHVLCHENGHSPLFYEIEDELRREAVKQGYIEEEYTPDVTYPCQ